MSIFARCRQFHSAQPDQESSVCELRAPSCSTGTSYWKPWTNITPGSSVVHFVAVPQRDCAHGRDMATTCLHREPPAGDHFLLRSSQPNFGKTPNCIQYNDQQIVCAWHRPDAGRVEPVLTEMGTLHVLPDTATTSAPLAKRVHQVAAEC